MMNESKHSTTTGECAEAPMPSEVIAFGRFRLRCAQRLLEKDGVRFKLGSRSLDILIALVNVRPKSSARENCSRGFAGSRG